MIAAIVGRLAEPDRVSALLSEAPPAARALFEDLRHARARGHDLDITWSVADWNWRWHPETATDGPWWLVARGLAMSTDGRYGLVIPAEVERAVRGRVFRDWPVDKPPVHTLPLPEARHPLELVATVTSLLQAWTAEPVAALQQGGPSSSTADAPRRRPVRGPARARNVRKISDIEVWPSHLPGRTSDRVTGRCGIRVRAPRCWRGYSSNRCGSGRLGEAPPLTLEVERSASSSGRSTTAPVIC